MIKLDTTIRVAPFSEAGTENGWMDDNNRTPESVYTAPISPGGIIAS